jgi:ABC-type multidrug transport system ATPase subunit
MTNMNLSIQSVGKQCRRDFWSLRGFSLELTSDVLGLLGPNGAGKFTLMRIIAMITDKTEGTVTWNGVDLSG